MKRSSSVAVGLTVSLALAVALGVGVGGAEVSVVDVFRALVGLESADRGITVGLRLPRVIMALLVGGGLAVSGAGFQSLLRNPLAEPYILGISSGAALGAVAVITFGWVAAASWGLPVVAFAGSIFALLLIFGFASASRAVMDVKVLLLAGVAVSAFFGSVIALMMTLAEGSAAQRALLWMMGSVANSSWNEVLIVATYTIPATLGLLGCARALNLLAIGEETAHHLGASVESMKRIVLLLSALIAASGVAFVGIIGFVGLVMPHVVRMVVVADNRVLLPIVFLAGANFLVFADLLARTVISPTELPIGVVTAVVGVPVFLILLRRSG